ncbi:MAG: serine hydrolase [Nitrospirae bacterium]|nr:serine hydrolase [Nitrospirota bacterium]MBI3593835.1 serine hydrolase [Nitrospirota bacterium]
MKPGLKQLTLLLQSAIADHAFSGASLLVFNHGEIIFEVEAGETSWKIEGLKPKKVDSETLFDLASLTKPLATVFLMSLLVQSRKLSLDDRVGNILVAPLDSEKGNTSIRELLSHSSGFPDWRPYYLEVVSDGTFWSCEKNSKEKASIFQKIHEEPFLYSPGSRTLYSDLGFILLGEMLECQSGISLDQLFIREIVEPLRIKNLGFRPLNLFGQERSFMATEKSIWRHKIVQGEVHDENACVMGGVAGHAGLFGTARSVYACFTEWRKGYRNESPFLTESIVKTFVERERFSADWGLGWMFPSDLSSAGIHFSKRSFGHLGFTGTSIWFDPVVDLGVIFLSNRIHPTRDNSALKEFRPILHDFIYNLVIHEKT